MKTICPICENEAKQIFKKYDWADVFVFYDCKKCHHVFIDPMPSEEKLSSFYNKEYYVPEFQRKKVREKGAIALKYMGSNQPILEIGSSYGYFLELLKEHAHEADGFELSQVASEVALKKGFRVFQGNIESASIGKNYGCIFMFDVLEHIRNPEAFLKNIHDLLLENGSIIMTVPNRDSLEFRLFGKYWEWTSPPAHLHYFGAKSTKEFFAKNGFTVNELFSIKGDTAGNIFFHLFDSMKRMILFKIGTLFYGREKFLAKKMEYNLAKKSNRQFQTKEFVGLAGIVFSLSKVFYVFDKVLRNDFNQPTLFIKVTKNAKSEN